VITGYNSLERVKIARDAGVTEFLIKPFKATDVAKRIEHVINHPRDFVSTADFFGPDRRRKIDKNYNGPKRRKEDKLKALDW
jgi:DNA-binding NtrC family response regulator